MDRLGVLAPLMLLLLALPASSPAAGLRHREGQGASPVRRLDRSHDVLRSGAHRPRGAHTHGDALGVRSLDGTGNHPLHDAWGAALTPLRRLLPADYADGASAMAGAGRPGPREVSNAVVAQPAPVANPLGTSDFLWQWGQFLDHDLDLTDGVVPPEPAPIAVPAGDPWFDPGGSGAATIPFNRSLYDPATGDAPGRPRQQINEITAWIDASNVYGSDPERAAALRTLDGTGRLKTSPGDLLPFNHPGLPNAGGPGADLFMAGDVRANEQVGLAALHTLFVREHNRLVAALARRHPRWSGEQLYQKARQIVGAQMQVITYREFLPALLGPGPLPPWRGYAPDVDPAISNAFATAAYRFGHSALSPTLLRLDRRGREIDAGHLPLRDAFFAPERIADEGGIEPLLRGLAAQRHQRIDVQVVDDVRNFLFGAPGAGGFDLPALNIQRGRDHGLPGYNAARAALGLAPAASFDEVSSDPDTRTRLAAVYADPDAIDLWVGCLAEDPVPGGHLGELARTILVEQFRALRDGDRFWYQSALPPAEVRVLEATRLADIIRRNTRIGRELNDDVFRVGRRR